MASAPSKTTTVKTVNNITGVTTARKTVVSGGSSTSTTTKTIGTKVSAPKKAATAKKATTTPAKAAGTVLAGTRWIVGPNESGWTMCGPVAVANHLLAVTGVEASNADMEALYRTAGGIGDTGAPLEFCLAAAHVSGLAGCRLHTWQRAERPEDAGVLLLDIDGLTGAHAAAVVPGGKGILWGAEVDLTDLAAHVIDAWTLNWHDA
jgi:hypothetical protein